MKYSPVVPTVPGWYWTKTVPTGRRKFIVELEMHEGALCYWSESHGEWWPVESIAARYEVEFIEWAGPIAEPNE